MNGIHGRRPRLAVAWMSAACLLLGCAVPTEVPVADDDIGARIGAEYEAVTGRPLAPKQLAEAVRQVRARSDKLVSQIAQRLAKAELHRQEVGPLDQPRVVLQVRSGAGGGNPNRIDMVRRTTPYVRRQVRERIAFEPVVDMREHSVAFCDGGCIPAGFEFVITRVTYRGTAAGDSNGHGEFVVGAGGKTIVKVRDSAKGASGSWDGEVVVRAGEEAQVFVEVANSSAGEAVFEGTIRRSAEDGAR